MRGKYSNTVITVDVLAAATVWPSNMMTGNSCTHRHVISTVVTEGSTCLHLLPSDLNAATLSMRYAIQQQVYITWPWFRGLKNRDSVPRRCKRFFACVQHPHCFWYLHNLLPSGCQGFFPWGGNCLRHEVAIHHYLMPELRPHGPVRPLPYRSSWPWCSFKHRMIFTFSLQKKENFIETVFRGSFINNFHEDEFPQSRILELVKKCWITG
jgi:hypothetical protein